MSTFHTVAIKTWKTYLGQLESFYKELDDAKVYILGDFNASAANAFGPILKKFCGENDRILSDEVMLPQNSFTHISDISGCNSWIDHCVASFSAHQSITDMKILHEFIISDHRPILIALNVNCQATGNYENSSNLSGIHSEIIKTNINWCRVSMADKSFHCNYTKCELGKLRIPWDAVKCNNSLCKNERHRKSVTDYYGNLV